MSILNIFKKEKTLSEIDAELTSLRQEKERIQEKLKALVTKRDWLVAKETANQKLAQMTPAERKALGLPEPQAVHGVGGIMSKEAF